MSRLGVPSRYITTKKTSTKRKTRQNDNSRSIISSKPKNGSQRKINSTERLKNSEELIDKKFAAYIEMLEREESEKSIERKSNLSSFSHRKNSTTNESSVIHLKPKYKKRKVTKKSTSRNLSVSSNSRLYDESSSSNLNTSRRNTSAQQSYAISSRKRAHKHIDEANSYLQSMSESSNSKKVAQKRKQSESSLTKPKKVVNKQKKNDYNDSDKSTDSYAKTGISIEEISNQMRINKDLLSKLDFSSSGSLIDVDSSHESSSESTKTEEKTKAEIKLAISEPFEFTTSDTLSDEIDQLKSLIDELKNINKALWTRMESPQSKTAFPDTNLDVSDSYDYQTDNLDVGIPPPKLVSPKPVLKNTDAYSSSSFEEEEKQLNESKSKEGSLSSKALSDYKEEEEEEEENYDDLIAKIKYHLNHESSEKDNQDDEEEDKKQVLTKSGKILWSTAEDDKIETLDTYSDNQESEEMDPSEAKNSSSSNKLVEEEEESSHEIEIPALRMNEVDNNVEHDPFYEERREAWETRFNNPTSESAEEEDTVVRSSVGQTQPRVTMNYERNESSSSHESEPQRNIQESSNSSVVNDNPARTIILSSDSSDEDIPLSGRVSSFNTPQESHREPEKPIEQVNDNKSVHLTPEQWMEYFSESDDVKPKNSSPKQKNVEKKTEVKPIEAKNDSSEEDNYSDNDIRRFIEESMKLINNNSYSLSD